MLEALEDIGDGGEGRPFSALVAVERMGGWTKCRAGQRGSAGWCFECLGTQRQCLISEDVGDEMEECGPACRTGYLALEAIVVESISTCAQ